MSRNTRKVVLSSALATGGTFTVGYDTDWNGGHFLGGVDHIITSSYGVWKTSDGDFDVTFGLTSATVTYQGATTVASGTELWVEFDSPGRTQTELENFALPEHVSKAHAYLINLGTPIALDRNGLFLSAIVAGAGAVTMDGALVAGGEADLDVPRNITVYSAGNASGANFTITGEDVHGNAMSETIAGPNTTTTAGVKAFKKVTAVTADAGSGVAVEIGTGDVLGLPVHLGAAAFVVAELEDWAAATAGTLVVGLDADTVSTATTADVRGTYDANSASDGAKTFALIALLPNPDWLGNAQYSA